METLILVIAVFVGAWLFGFLKSIRSAAQMANEEVATLRQLHKATVVERLASSKTTAAKVEKAKSNLALLETIDLFADYEQSAE